MRPTLSVVAAVGGILGYIVGSESWVKETSMQKARVYGSRCVLLPLQSAKEMMHAIRTLDVSRHKQLAMGIYIDHNCNKSHVGQLSRLAYTKANMQCDHEI